VKRTARATAGRVSRGRRAAFFGCDATRTHWSVDNARWDLLLNLIRDTLLRLKWTPEGYPCPSTRPPSVSLIGAPPVILNT